MSNPLKGNNWQKIWWYCHLKYLLLLTLTCPELSHQTRQSSPTSALPLWWDEILKNILAFETFTQPSYPEFHIRQPSLSTALPRRQTKYGKMCCYREDSHPALLSRTLKISQWPKSCNSCTQKTETTYWKLSYYLEYIFILLNYSKLSRRYIEQSGSYQLHQEGEDEIPENILYKHTTTAEPNFGKPKRKNPILSRWRALWRSRPLPLLQLSIHSAAPPWPISAHSKVWEDCGVGREGGKKPKLSTSGVAWFMLMSMLNLRVKDQRERERIWCLLVIFNSQKHFRMSEISWFQQSLSFIKW